MQRIWTFLRLQYQVLVSAALPIATIWTLILGKTVWCAILSGVWLVSLVLLWAAWRAYDGVRDKPTLWS